MLTDPKLILFLQKAIASLNRDMEKNKLSTIDTVLMCGKIEAFQEVLNYGTPNSKRKRKQLK
jgi:hypothetical protein